METLILIWVIGWAFTAGSLMKDALNRDISAGTIAGMIILSTCFWPVVLGILWKDSP